MTGADLLAGGAARLAKAGIESPRLEARLLLAHAAGLAPEALLRDLRDPIAAPGFDALLTRRARREPLAYLLGRREFWSLPFAVSPATLIPRPDSETVVQAALAAAPWAKRVLDLGTGTGCLLLAVLNECPGAWGVGVDLDPRATALAAHNAAALGLGDRAVFLCADWAAPLAGKFDLVLSNPPYIQSADIAGLEPEVSAYEPGRALDGGPDGLDAYRHLAATLPDLLAADGVAVLEVGAGQDRAVTGLMRSAGLDTACVHNDMTGVARAVTLVRSAVRLSACRPK